MKIIIDNFDGLGPRDYTGSLEAGENISIHRALNRPVEAHATLLSSVPQFVVPAAGARVQLVGQNGSKLFTGYVCDPPAYEYLGWTMCGPGYRYKLVALSDEFLLDRKTVPARAPMAGRTAGEALRLLTEEVFPGELDTSGIDDVSNLASLEVDPHKKWSQHAAEIALRSRASYRVHDGAVILKAIPASVHQISETSPAFSPGELSVRCSHRVINDFTILGKIEPQAYVKDYFCGDGLSLRFDLSQIPFTRGNRMLLDEEFKGTSLDPVRWMVKGDANSVSVGLGKLQLRCNGPDGTTVVQFSENLEMGGALVINHGQVSFSGACEGVIGGLYNATVSTGNCLAGFRVTPVGNQSAIQAIIRGIAIGPIITTASGHRYSMTTRTYASEIYRSNELFHSSIHPSGRGLGGELIDADLRIVIELHDIDPSNPNSVGGPPTVLYDGLLYDVPGCCSYALFNGGTLQCDVTFTRILRPVDAEVRSAVPGDNYRTRLPGALSEGAECSISESPALQFFSAFVPESNEKILVSYRGRGRSAAHINDPSSINSEKRGNDNGVFGTVCEILSPSPNTSADCSNAALALLDDSVREAWTGEYRFWSDSLSTNEDIYPGDAIDVSAPTRNADFRAIVREVEIYVHEVANDHLEYRVRFADDQAEPLALAFTEVASATVPVIRSLATSELRTPLPALTAAEVIDITSTSITIDTGVSPPTGGGIEVRRSDAGWGPDNDRNLIGRFGTRVIAVPRLSRVQDYFLREYDASSPPIYSGFSTAIHVDYPL
jgi:hypothetical protein